MKKKKILFSVLLFNLLVLCCSNLLYAFPYHPTVPITIETEAHGLDAKNPGLIRLLIHTRLINDRRETVFATLNDPENTRPISIITFSDTIPVGVQKNPASSVKTFTDSLYFATGYPIPLDILPVSQDTGTKEYYNTRSVGGRTFKQKVVVTITILTVEEATSKGWIQLQPGLDPQIQLRLFTATTTDKLLSRQLWSDDSEWWFYEETPFRRSWRIQ